MILIHPCTGSSYKSFGFWVFFLTRVGRSAAMAVQINRMGGIDRLSQGASGKSRLKPRGHGAKAELQSRGFADETPATRRLSASSPHKERAVGHQSERRQGHDSRRVVTPRSDRGGERVGENARETSHAKTAGRDRSSSLGVPGEAWAGPSVPFGRARHEHRVPQRRAGLRDRRRVPLLGELLAAAGERRPRSRRTRQVRDALQRPLLLGLCGSIGSAIVPRFGVQ
jgi:hypothetical protein